MKKKGIALLAIILCLGASSPAVLAEETETVQEDVTVEELQDEAADKAAQ